MGLIHSATGRLLAFLGFPPRFFPLLFGLCVVFLWLVAALLGCTFTSVYFR